MVSQTSLTNEAVAPSINGFFTDSAQICRCVVEQGGYNFAI